MKYSIFLLLVLASLISCNQPQKNEPVADFEIKSFSALTNYQPENKINTKTIELDYDGAFYNGFIIPSVRQIKEGVFAFSFLLKNNSANAKKFSWKIYYKNVSYCFPETEKITGNENYLAEENFYGSYSDSSILFKTTADIPADGQFHLINDSLNILGNPRCEAQYYHEGRNDRWKRNPRTGIYSFMLAVTEAENINKNIPEFIQNVCLKKNNHFVSPFYFFEYQNKSAFQNTITLGSKDSLKVVARPDLGGGIFIKHENFSDEIIRKHERTGCGADPNMLFTSCFTQFIHYVDNSAMLQNIPVMMDVLKDNYSKTEYNWNRSFYEKEELISTLPRVAKIPCETVYSDPVNKKIVLRNPKSTADNLKKENVGISSLHGFSYGKLRVKAKLPELLNKNNVWTGITNAIWLISQPGGTNWNLRRTCRKEGYMKTYWGGRDDKRVARVDYAEIDFEILKTPSYCPIQSFPPVYRNATANQNDVNRWNVSLPNEILKDDGNISVSCTNWDMACWEPVDFNVGCNPISYEGKTYEAHRWDHWYRAITEKTQASDDLLFGSPFYYFEIDWRPMEIIWRIGPDPDNMYVVGYMNDKMTSIPNNQLVLVITQEFHNTKWWPGSPYQQDNIPFPSNDIVGEIYEIVIE